ncbi:double-strand break repair helicase AddA [uncultured Maricaulis sp.]|uniref:double-strand break repair helicase AddA n=1 Tax=uncultured Maricaulis sp. TaxID=174710 RepID=UPI0030DABF19
MSEPGFDPDIIKRATAEQDLAADPVASVFVEANAGSGKTRVLVNRVINILLGGTQPDQILCVTYTKAAAAEMKERLFDRLGHWSVMPDIKLGDELKKLGQKRRDAPFLASARRLFAMALETPGGLKIQTIHAFCENLLRRFPLEAGAPPGFKTLDDSEAAKVVETARRRMLQGLGRETVDTLLQAGGPDALGNILRWTRFNRHKLRDALGQAGDPDALIGQMYALFDLPEGTRSAAVKAETWAGAPHAHLAEAVIALRNFGSKADHTRAAALDAALKAATPDLAFDACLPVYFITNGEGSRAKSLVTQTCARDAPSLPGLFEAEAERFELARELVRTAQVAEASAAALRVATLFLDAYDAEMLRQRALDFDDLIVLSGHLLSDANPFSGWVGYKLDGRLAHALVDEAQDTAPRQWDMIASLTAEFFAGKGANEDARTLFVVGDEKQSIYSFQGAEPARFIAEGDALGERADAAGLKFTRPGLDVSFRSAPEILQAVDQAFAPIAASAPETKFQNADPARPFAFYHNHKAARSGTPGCVEFWPSVPKPEAIEEGSIFDPVDTPGRGSARDILAQTIAGEIRAMIDRGDAVWHETDGRFEPRPVQPRDIAILVWRRTGGFFEEVIRQLKLAQVPVAGADRMVLREQTVVKDLLALGRLAITPGDDLALAELLKSPFFDPVASMIPPIDDDALFDLAQTRRNSHRGALWNALFTSTDPRFAEARAALIDWRNRADSEGLYDVYCGFLNARTPTGESRWARVLARLGEEARDPAEVFLGRALEHEGEHGGAMASFVASLQGEETQLKREMSTDRDEVQVMTVHASKGLERPVIILPDTTRSPATGKGEPIFSHAAAGLIWSQRKAEDPPLVAEMRETDAARAQAEHGRLLYVALTRARDRLIVCGWRQGRGAGSVAKDSWYTQLAAQWSGDDWVEFDTPLSARVEAIGPGLRLGAAPVALGAHDRAATARVKLPAWAIEPAASEAGALRAIAPSRLLAEEEMAEAVISPLLDPGGQRFRRGEVIHKLLETLPGLDPDRRREAAVRFVAAQPDIDEAARSVIVEETLGILDHPDFAALFGPGSRAEVALTGTAPGLPPGTKVRGQVDRLVVTDHEVLIVDYKTNRPPPVDVSGVARVYLGQMAAYRALLRSLHPGKTVRCALLWTDAARLMEIPAELLDGVLSGANS